MSSDETWEIVIGSYLQLITFWRHKFKVTLSQLTLEDTTVGIVQSVLQINPNLYSVHTICQY